VYQIARQSPVRSVYGRVRTNPPAICWYRASLPWTLRLLPCGSGRARNLRRRAWASQSPSGEHQHGQAGKTRPVRWKPREARRCDLPDRWREEDAKHRGKGLAYPPYSGCGSEFPKTSHEGPAAFQRAVACCNRWPPSIRNRSQMCSQHSSGGARSLHGREPDRQEFQGRRRQRWEGSRRCRRRRSSRSDPTGRAILAGDMVLKVEEGTRFSISHRKTM
jgi:hypothetical protein